VYKGRRCRRKTTKGWKLAVKWKDGSCSLEDLKDLKETVRNQVAEYAVAKGIADEPAFAWWVPYFLKKRDNIISKLKTRLARKK
jgi:methionine synthase II (cobalamin-independent)